MHTIKHLLCNWPSTRTAAATTNTNPRDIFSMFILVKSKNVVDQIKHL